MVRAVPRRTAWVDGACPSARDYPRRHCLKDKPADSRHFLDNFGNPYRRIGIDQLGTAAIDFGVYGVPETYIVDGSGHMRYRHVGPLGERDVNRKILPLIAKIADAGKQRGADE